MTRKLRQRIEKLEQAFPPVDRDPKAVARRAFLSLGDKLDGFISSLGAERLDRELTEEEVAGKRAYAEALARECRIAGYSSTEGFEDLLDIAWAKHIWAARYTFTREKLLLCIRAAKALDQLPPAARREELYRCLDDPDAVREGKTLLSQEEFDAYLIGLDAVDRTCPLR